MKNRENGLISNIQKYPLFSVIILIYNNSQYFEYAMESVFEQTYPNIEVVIADDMSKEYNKELMEEFCKRRKKENISNILIYQNKLNLGTVKNINTAISKCSGEFIKVLAVDDALYDKETLINAARAILNSPDGIVVGDAFYCDANSMKDIYKMNSNFYRTINELTPKQMFYKLCIRNHIVAGSVFFSKQFYEKFGPFDERCKLIEDWPMWLKVSKNGGKIIYNSFNTIKYRGDVGVARKPNPYIIKDRNTIFYEYIKSNQGDIDRITFFKAIISHKIRTSYFMRKVYSIIIKLKGI